MANQYPHNVCQVSWGFIDDKPTWSNHITYRDKKLLFSVGMCYWILQYLSDSTLTSLHFSFVYSNLQFAGGAWGGVSGV